MNLNDTAEGRRLTEAREGTAAWRRWGPYLSERQWGTVREDYSEGGTARLIDAGRLRIPLHETFAFEEAADAQRLVEDGHVHGKVALTFPGS